MLENFKCRADYDMYVEVTGISDLKEFKCHRGVVIGMWIRGDYPLDLIIEFDDDIDGHGYKDFGTPRHCWVFSDISTNPNYTIKFLGYSDKIKNRIEFLEDYDKIKSRIKFLKYSAKIKIRNILIKLKSVRKYLNMIFKYRED